MIFFDLLAPGVDRYLRQRGFELAYDGFVPLVKLGPVTETLSFYELRRCFEADDYAGIDEHLERVMLKNLLGDLDGN